MRRKVLQDYANVFCQHFLDLGSGSDAATFARRGSGQYQLNILTGQCSKDGQLIPELKACSDFRGWLAKQLAKDWDAPVSGSSRRVSVSGYLAS